ncbi:MAG: hypothetical protein JWM07_324 [Candidatus Saccharibacteria bacterium]|jgi:hypothetical protein|nr:hypothetical protein [Candidatus Saccharibacteria bacterium]
MQAHSRDSIDLDLQIIIDSVTIAQKMIDLACTDLSNMIHTTTSELIAKWRPSIPVRNITLDGGQTVISTLLVFPLPNFSTYAVADTFDGVISLSHIGGKEPRTTVGKAIPTRDIPLTEQPERYPHLSIEKIANKLTIMRLDMRDN